MPAPTNLVSNSPIIGHKKFGTFAGLGQNRSGTNSGASASIRPGVKGLFDDDSSHSSSAFGAANPKLGLIGLNASERDDLGAGAVGKGVDGPWSISVAEAKEKREGRKRKQVQSNYTLYITTPTHNLTLTRSAADIIELDHKIREGQSQSTTLPNLPQIPNSSPPQTSGRRILKTLSRTLSPSGGRNRAALSALGLEPPTSPNSLTGEAARLGSSPPPSAPLSPTLDGMNLSIHSTTTHLATYFTSIANIPFIKRHKAWNRFVRVGSDDLQSVRVERRVRKVRSDLAQHVKSSVAPTNTNVGVSPSQSYLGEEGPTEDERDDHPALFQQEAASQSFASAIGNLVATALPNGIPARTSSVDPDRASTIEDKSMSSEYEGRVGNKPPNYTSGPDGRRSESSTADAETSRRRSTRCSTRRGSPENDKVTVDDFEMIRVLGKGCAGKVLLVKHSSSKGLFAMKSIHKRHVLAHQELQHTLTEQSVLKRMVKDVVDPFVVRLWWSFHDRNNLYLVMDFHPGGDLATQLSRWGRLGRDRARFYAAEIVEGVEGLHKAGVIYRDLKPENVLIGGDGHIVLSDFGLSKEFSGHPANGTSTPPPTSPGRSQSSNNVNVHTQSAHWLSASEDSSNNRATGRSFLDQRETTSTFCGTAEYLAPEVIQGSPYSYEVDWWSFGTMLYEMLTGITPFWADTHAEMYTRVLHDDLTFPEDRVMDPDTKSIIRGLLQRNPMLRMKESRIKKHPYFSMIEWDHIFHKRYIPPYIPPIDPQNEYDTQNFDQTFLEMQPTVAHAPEDEDADQGTEVATSTEDAKSDDKGAKDGHSAKKTSIDDDDLFDGYSFRGRRDSESVKSSIMSTGPGDSVISEEASGAGVAPEPSSSSRSTASHSKVSRSTAVEEEEEDDDSAARAAVAALAHLENEANGDATLGNISMTPSQSTQPPSYNPSRDTTSNGTSDSDHSHISNVFSSPASSYMTSKATGKPSLSAGGMPTNAAIRELEDEDDDWDMVEVEGPDGTLKSEVNGGKGANLFARGVVDTYRLLRRQESSRIPPSSSYSSTASRPFNRLGKRRTMVGAGSMSGKPSNGNLTSASAQSLDSRSGTERAGEEDMSGDQSLLSPQSENGANKQLGKGSSAEDVRRSVASSGSDDNKYQARIKKIKRFTTFFEPASHR